MVIGRKHLQQFSVKFIFNINVEIRCISIYILYLIPDRFSTTNRIASSGINDKFDKW